MIESEKIKAGSWIRFSAFVIDTIFIFLVTTIFASIAQYFNFYIPFEFSFLILFTFYSVISLSLKNFTIGKRLCGLAVLQKDEMSIGFFKSIIREFIGKFTVIILFPYALSALILRGSNNGMSQTLLPILIIFLFLIIFLIQYLITKRTWYDYLSSTFVYQTIKSKKHNKYFIFTSVILVTLLLGKEVTYFINKYNVNSYYSVYALAKPKPGNINKLIEISTLDSTKINLYTKWLNNNGKAPRNYILDKVSKHQVTIFGEMHDISNYLVFFKELIPELYNKAGVRCIAMEVCVHEDNKLINKLITSKEYDKELALEIGRHQPWLVWGDKEYWDILKAVWMLNKSLKPNQQKMEVIGLDSKWDGPSFALTRGTENGKSGPLIEKLRIFRALHSLPLLIYRDELMANQIEKEIIDKNKKAIVWVGAGHSYLNYKQPHQIKGRMAYILYKKYGDKIFQILLHNNYISVPIANWIERSVAKSKFKQIGLDLFKSSFNVLRDSSSSYFRFEPDVCLGDLADGYVYLVPCDSLKPGKFIINFISPKMFASEKPYYELIAGKSFSNSKQVNNYIINNIGK